MPRHPRRRRPLGELRVFFETADDHLAAFLSLRGCRRVGFGLGDPPSEKISHVFDDRASRLVPAVKAYQRGVGDAVSASRFAAHARHLEQLRSDEELRHARTASGC